MTRLNLRLARDICYIEESTIKNSFLVVSLFLMLSCVTLILLSDMSAVNMIQAAAPADIPSAGAAAFSEHMRILTGLKKQMSDILKAYGVSEKRYHFGAVQELNCAYFLGEMPTAFVKAFKKLL